MITIKNDRQLKTAIDFLGFVQKHRIESLKEENETLKKQVDDLEREVRVSRDLLAIAGRCK